MFEATSDRRTRAALDRAHLERGRAVRSAFRWLIKRGVRDTR